MVWYFSLTQSRQNSTEHKSCKNENFQYEKRKDKMSLNLKSGKSNVEKIFVSDIGDK